jgi:putative Mg2+ transporter-C (MgtC) family protein
VDAPSSLELIGRLALALALGAVLGLERETRHKTAGLRTHSLVALGAALFTIAGAYAVIGPQNDPSRVAAQVVTGIGFIGAGAMIRSGFTVTGITTAATLWMAAAFGIAAAMGLYVVSIVAGAMALVVVVTFGPLKPYVLFRRSRRRFEVQYRPGHGTLDALLMGLESGGGRIMGVLTTESDDPSQGLRQTTIDVRGMAEVELAKVLATIADRDEVVEIDHAPGNGT